MKKILIAVFAVVALAQWAAPLSMIWRSERVLNKGKVFRFETMPVDPEDPLRGRYVSLDFKATSSANFSGSLEHGDDVYATIAADGQGYAYITAVSENPPSNTNDYLSVKMNYFLSDSNAVVVEYPFEEFFLDEYKASVAENLYLQSMRDSIGHTYALIHVYKGKGVISDLIINGKSVQAYFK
ncbi:MAG TPA: GDYXXLXY domain-containing protein [Chitinophagaceae bacterium]|nr:GDYXXLXY domain-containing protein [Chitinophagaceae bacterium]